MKVVSFTEFPPPQQVGDTTEYIYYKQVKQEDIVIAYQTLSGKPIGLVVKNDDYIIIQRGSANKSIITAGQPHFDKLIDFLQFHSFNYQFKVL